MNVKKEIGFILLFEFYLVHINLFIKFEFSILGSGTPPWIEEMVNKVYLADWMDRRWKQMGHGPKIKIKTAS